MELFIEQFLVYGVVGLFIAGILWWYLRSISKRSKLVEVKIEMAKEAGLHEPLSLHPVINPDICIGSGACIVACPEKDILGMTNGRATLINASRCIGHGACFHACPVEAITLCIGTEKRGVDLPHINHDFETNIPGMYIAGELGGMGLIKNSVEQGKQAVDNIMNAGISNDTTTDFDVIIIGAGPAGISAALEAKKQGLKAIILEQYTLGGTVYNFPRAKIVMTAPMELPLYGKVNKYEISKEELLKLWQKVIKQNKIKVVENTKVESIHCTDNLFKVITKEEKTYTANKILLAIGRRGSPRKLNVPGENLGKVAYRLLEPDRIKNKKILIVGGGDSAIEAALALEEQNEVHLSYRKDKFSRIKEKNADKIHQIIEDEALTVIYNSNVKIIEPDRVLLSTKEGEDIMLKNDLVYIFAGGELPTDFLKKAGIKITKRFGYTMMKH